jgi:MFS family permease
MKIHNKHGLTNILAMNFFYSMIVASVATILPLYMLEKGFSISSIGLVLSVMPLIFLVIRIVLSSIGDQTGTRPIFFINAISNLASVIIYWVSASPLGFAIGKVFEGGRASAFWAVNRTEIYDNSKLSELKDNAVKIVGVRSAGDVFGRIFAGIILTALTMFNVFVSLGVLSLSLFYFSGKVKDNHQKMKLDGNIMKKIFAKRSNIFWLASLPLGFIGAIDYFLFSFVFPVYMDASLHMTYAEIGFMIGLFSATFTIFIFAFRKNTSDNFLFWLIIPLAVVPLLLFFTIDNVLFAGLICILAVGWAISFTFFEKIVAWATSKSKNVSTEIGVIHAPQRILEFILLASGGFIISYFGFFGIFILSAVFVVIFMMVLWPILHKMKKSEVLVWE